MKWRDIQQSHPNQWLVIEALTAHSMTDHTRVIEEAAVVKICATGADAMSEYRSMHALHPGREFYFIHTSRKALRLQERIWAGVRA